MIAHVFKRKRRRAGRVETSDSYYARYRLDGEYAVTEVCLETSDKMVAERKLSDLVREKERERAGLIAPKLQRLSAQKALSAHLGDFKADLATLGRCEKYRSMIPARITRLLKDCSWQLPANITPDAFVAWRSRQTKLGPKTLNEYLNAMNTLLNWMERQGRIEANPLRKIERVDVRGKQQRRRAFTDDEFNRLLSVAGERRLLYLTAAYTGLRLGELRQLVWDDLKLDHERPHIMARASTTKNRKESLIPLHPQLLAEMKAAKSETAQKQESVFAPFTNADRFIRRDFTRCGIVRIDAMGRKIDFHALRYTFATKLASNGISMRLAQELMRHSDPRLTANIYTDTTCLPTFDAVKSLPWLTEETKKQPTSAASFGTQNGTQTSDFAGQKLTSVVAHSAAEKPSNSVLLQADRPVLAGPDMDGKMAEREGFERPGRGFPGVPFAQRFRDS